MTGLLEIMLGKKRKFSKRNSGAASTISSTWRTLGLLLRWRSQILHIVMIHCTIPYDTKNKTVYIWYGFSGGIEPVNKGQYHIRQLQCIISYDSMNQWIANGLVWLPWCHILISATPNPCLNRAWAMSIGMAWATLSIGTCAQCSGLYKTECITVSWYLNIVFLGEF